MITRLSTKRAYSVRLRKGTHAQSLAGMRVKARCQSSAPRSCWLRPVRGFRVKGGLVSAQRSNKSRSALFSFNCRCSFLLPANVAKSSRCGLAKDHRAESQRTHSATSSLTDTHDGGYQRMKPTHFGAHPDWIEIHPPEGMSGQPIVGTNCLLTGLRAEQAGYGAVRFIDGVPTWESGGSIIFRTSEPEHT